MKNSPPGRYMSIGLTYAVLAVVLGVAMASVVSTGAGILVALVFGAVALVNFAIAAIGLGVRSAHAGREQDHAG